jgi:ABC-type Mn2+/Zn2+ transport system ATPase subunit
MLGSEVVITATAIVTHPEGTVLDEQGNPVDTTEENK